MTPIAQKAVRQAERLNAMLFHIPFTGNASVTNEQIKAKAKEI
jgi:hypothetical protein